MRRNIESVSYHMVQIYKCKQGSRLLTNQDQASLLVFPTQLLQSLLPVIPEIPILFTGSEVLQIEFFEAIFFILPQRFSLHVLDFILNALDGVPQSVAWLASHGIPITEATKKLTFDSRSR